MPAGRPDAAAGPAPGLRCDVAVVGGGPAGLAAALGLSQAGADVVLLEEADELGGQYFKRRQAMVLSRYGDYRPEGTALIEQVRRAGVRCLTGRLVWGVADDDRTLLTADAETGAALSVAGRACIVASGAYERSIPFPGWQLPGVVTPGYALHLASCDRVPLGERVLLAGTGPFLLAAACAVLQAGGGVRAVVELNTPYWPSAAALSAARFPGRLRELAGYAARLARSRVPVLQGQRVTRATGRGRIENVTVQPVSRGAGGGVGAGGRMFEVDGLAAGFGFRPASELIRLLGADCVQDQLGDVFPVVDPMGRTSVERLYAAGEIVQVAGMRAAQARGLLAAAAAAEDLGLDPGRLPEAAVRAAKASLRTERRFAALTARIFPVTAAQCRAVPDDTLVCRCEGVTAGQIRRSGALAGTDSSAAKAVTRAGMGPCQGRQCATTVLALVEQASGRKATAFAARVPVKPVPVAALTGTASTGAALARGDGLARGEREQA